MTKLVSLFVGAFLGVEIAIRAAVRTFLEVGETIHLGGPVYLTNAANQAATMAFGWSAVTWLLIALVVAALFLLFFSGVAISRPTFAGHKGVKLGILAASTLCGIALLNTSEYIWLGGVTDYLAWINLGTKRGYIINIADVVIPIAAIAICVSYVGTVVSLIRGSWSTVQRPVQ